MRRLLAMGLGATALWLAGFQPWLLASADVRQDQVVAHVGKKSITVADVERRAATIPGFQLGAFGKTVDEVRHNLLERVLIPEALFAEAGDAKKVDQSPALRERIDS